MGYLNMASQRRDLQSVHDQRLQLRNTRMAKQTVSKLEATPEIVLRELEAERQTLLDERQKADRVVGGKCLSSVCASRSGSKCRG
jgi:hypothetical protein